MVAGLERQGPQQVGPVSALQHAELEVLALEHPSPILEVGGAVGEGDQEEMFDYGWIEDRSVREVRWIMQYHETDWAGGARKNRRIDSVIELPAGDYLLHFVTDDSHAYGSWNSSAPSEPELYGIRLEVLD